MLVEEVVGDVPDQAVASWINAEGADDIKFETSLPEFGACVLRGYYCDRRRTLPSSTRAW